MPTSHASEPVLGGRYETTGSANAAFRDAPNDPVLL
jgi:hypothetical protein